MTKFSPNSADYWRLLIRCIHVLPMFDRVMLSLIANIPYGTVSRIVCELEKEGYIQPVVKGNKTLTKKWNRELPESNSDMRVYGRTGKRVNWAMTDESIIYHKMYQKTDNWSEFLDIWNTFLGPAKRKREMNDFQNFFRQYGVPYAKEEKETLTVADTKFRFKKGVFLSVEPKQGPAKPREIREDLEN